MMLERVLTAIRDTQVPLENLILLFAGGSNLHGARIEGKNDLDIYGVFFEPEVNIFGLTPFEHYVTSTSDQTERNSPDDIDITLYSFRRWVQLACKGNPTALSFLFANNLLPRATWAVHNIEMRDAILAKSAAKHFKGFVQGQMNRLLGTRGLGKHGQRPELEIAHGYDTKAAMHAVRLMGEGIELMQTGSITYPRHDKETLIKIRQGEFSLDRICSTVSEMITLLDEAVEKSPLPESPDRARVNAILVDAYKSFYGYGRD
jgi:uncharacterized protein